MKKHLLLSFFASLLIVFASPNLGMAQIAYNGFEENAGDTWTISSLSTPACTNGSDTWDYRTSLSSISPSVGSQFWGMQDINGNCGGSGYETITFSSTNVSAYTAVTISFEYWTIGYDGTDYLGYEIWEDGTKVVDETGLTKNSGEWLTVTYNVNSGVANVYLVLKAQQNGGSDYAAFDNVILDGTIASTDTRVNFTTETSTVTEDGLYVDVCASITNPSASVATTVDINLVGGGTTAINGTDYDDGAGTPAAISFPQTLTFPANSSADQCFTIYISVDDTDIEVDETIELVLENAAGGTAADVGTGTSHIVTIEDNDAPPVCLTEGFEGGSSVPTDWDENSAYFNTGVANSGTYKAGMNGDYDWIMTSQLINPYEVSFYGRASNNSANYTIDVEYATSSAGPWTTAASFYANGSNSGDITDSYQELSAVVNLTGLYYIRWHMSVQASGSFYLDDVSINCTPSAPSACPGQMSGVYTINPSAPASCTNYQDFASAVSDMVSGARADDYGFRHDGGISGAVVFEVATDTYTEQISIDEIPGASATNTVTFKSASGTNTDVILTFASSGTFSDPNYTLQLNGADYIRFEDMTIERTGTSTYANVIEFAGDASNNIFDGNRILGKADNASSGNSENIICEDANAGNTLNAFTNNTIVGGYSGIFWEGSSGTPLTNLTISNNTFELYRYGMYLRYTDNAVITGNTITTGTDYNTASTSAIELFNADQNLTITSNTITLTGGTTNYGIYINACAGSSGAVGNVSNNMVSIAGTGNSYAIYSGSGTSYKNYYHNSCYSSGTNTSSSRTFYLNGSNNINLNSNAFVSENGYAIYILAETALASNYNDFFSNGTNLGYWDGTHTTLASFQASNSSDANSISADPSFTSATDLHVTAGSPTDAAATTGLGITVDIDGETRNATTPDIGADEYESLLPVVTLTASANAGTEAGTTVITLTATADGPVVGSQTVDIAATGTGITAGDYTLSNTTITITNPSTTGTVTFTVVDDAAVEGLETATLTISNESAGIAIGSPNSQDIAITDNDIAPNDDCAAAVDLTVNAAPTSGNMLGVTATNGGALDRPDVWYTFTPSCSGDHTVTTATSGMDLELELFDPSTCPTDLSDRVRYGYSSSNSSESLTYSVTAGTEYLIRVEDYSSVGNAFTIEVTTSVTPEFTLANTGTPATGNIGVNTTNQLIFGFALTADACAGTYNFTAADIATVGTATTADLSNFRIIVDANNNGVADAGEIASPIGTVASLANPLAFTGLGQTGLTGTTRYLLIADVAVGATSGRTITASLANTDVTSPVTVTGSAAGNTQTITAPCVAPTADAALALTPTASTVDGVITAPTGGATGYVVVRHTTTTLGGTPSTAATYTAGNSIGSGTVVYSGTGTTFTDAGPLSPSTAYFYFVFAYNNTSCGGGPVYAAEVEETVTTLAGPCLSETFDSGLPVGWSGAGTSTSSSSSHYSSAPITIALGTGDNLITPTVDYPSTISFYVDASGSGGEVCDLEYRVGAGAWTSIGTFTSTDAGQFETFPLTTSPNLTATADVSFRISSPGFTVYIDDVEIYCASAQPSIELSLEAPVSGTGTEADATTVTLRATASETLTAPHSVEVDISGTGITPTDFDNTVDFSNTVTINIANGASFGELTFHVADDSDVEGPETATFTISNPSSGVVIGTTDAVDLDITDNDNITSTESVIIEQSGEATGISSVVNGTITNNTQGTQVWAFNLYDGDGTNNDADSKPTIYEQWIIRADGANNTVPDWDATIDNVKFFLGASATPIGGSFLVNPTSISFLPSTPITVADGTTPAVITMRMTLDATLPVGSDGQHFAFSLDDSDVTVESDVLLSSQLGTFTQVSDANLNGIDITATLQFINAPTAVSVGSTFSVTVSAVDANGNVDTGITNSITLSQTVGSGTLTGAPTTVNLVNGTYTFTGLNHDTEEIIQITVHDNGGTFADLTANINVTDEPHQLFDDFNRADNGTVGIPSSETTATYAESGTGNGTRSRIEANQLLLANCNAGSGSGGSNGMEQVIFNVENRHETVYDDAGTILEWVFNINQNRTDPSGFGSNTYAAGVVLGSDLADTEAAGADGYAVIIGNSGNPDPVKLVRFTGGLNNNANVTDIAVSSETDDESHFSVKVTYDPCTGVWSLSVRDDGNSFAAPNVGSLGTAVTGTDQTHTALDLKYFGYVWQHGVSCTETATFDNVNIPNAPSAASIGKVWNGSVNADWNEANNWGPCAGVPTITDDVVIANVATQPVISAATPVAVCNNLTVDAGASLTINSNRELTADGDVTNNGAVTVEVGANFIQTTNGTAAHAGSGNFYVKRTSAGGYNGWSTPVVGGTLPGSNPHWYNSATGTSDPLDDNNPDPDPGWFPFSGAMQPSRGYYSSSAGTKTFIGKANNGTYNSVAITAEGAPGTRYNLVGNPYPSSIDADQFINDNSGRIDGSLYFWDDDNSGPTGYTLDDYATYTLAGAVPTNGGTNGSGPTPNGNIASCQGFFVSCTNSGNILFNNGQRGGNNNQFFRMAASDAQRIWLSMSNDNLQLFNQTLVGFDEFATDQKDWGVDAIKFRGNQSISIGAQQDNETYAIATYESIPQTGKVIPLMTFVENTATYTFVADSMEGFDNYHVFLEDLSTGDLYPLTQGDSYSFAMTSADEYNRFQLWFSPVLVTGVNETENDFNIYATANNMIVVETANGENFNGTVQITDMAGRSVLTNDISIANGIGRVQAANLANGVYAITFVSTDGNTTASQKVALGQ